MFVFFFLSIITLLFPCNTYCQQWCSTNFEHHQVIEIVYPKQNGVIPNGCGIDKKRQFSDLSETYLFDRWNGDDTWLQMEIKCFVRISINIYEKQKKKTFRSFTHSQKTHVCSCGHHFADRNQIPYQIVKSFMSVNSRWIYLSHWLFFFLSKI